MRGAPATARLLLVAGALSAALLIMDALPVLAPARVAACARAALAPTCHQREERSFRASGRTWAACARCTGLHAGGLLALLAFGATGGSWRPRALFAWTGIAAAAMGADVAAGVALEWDHALVRCATGALLSAGLLAWGAASISAERAS